MTANTGQGNVIRAVFFDFGGVLAEEGFREALKEIARRRGLDPEDFYQLGAEAVYDSGYVIGTGSEADFWDLMCCRSSLERYEDWFTGEILRRFELRPRMLSAVKELHSQGIIVAILSDQTDWLDLLEQRDHFFQHFDRVFNSYHLGKGKRDPNLFDDVTSALGVTPSQALFIDDNAGHVERASSRGLKTLLFSDEESFFSELVRFFQIQFDQHRR